MSNNGRWALALVAVLVIALGAYAVLNAPDQRTTGEKIGDAIDELPNLDKAGKELGDRTPGDRLNDAADDVKRDMNIQ